MTTPSDCITGQSAQKIRYCLLSRLGAAYWIKRKTAPPMMRPKTANIHSNAVVPVTAGVALAHGSPDERECW